MPAGERVIETPIAIALGPLPTEWRQRADDTSLGGHAEDLSKHIAQHVNRCLR